MLQFEINKTIAESYNPRNERLYTIYTIMYYGMVLTLPHTVEELGNKKKTIKKHKMSKFSCVHSVQILNAIIHFEVETKYTHIAQSNECDDSSSIDCWIFEPLIMFFQCALSFSFSVSFCLFSFYIRKSFQVFYIIPVQKHRYFYWEGEKCCYRWSTCSRLYIQNLFK